MEYGNLYLSPFQRKLLLKKLCEESLPPILHQRIKIMILADQGKSQVEICSEVGCCASTARHWIQMAQSDMAHLWESSPRGRPKTITDSYLKRLEDLLTHSPRDYKYPFSRWTADWLRKHLAQETGIDVSLRHFKRLLKQIKDTKKSNDDAEKPSPQSDLLSFQNMQAIPLHLTTASPQENKLQFVNLAMFDDNSEYQSFLPEPSEPKLMHFE